MLQKIDEQNEQQIINRAKPKLQRGENAQVVFQGDFFKVWHWPQELYDGSKTTFESLSRADTVTILALTTEEEVLVTRQIQPGLSEFLSLPGGVIDEGELVLKASKRELLEETGYSSNEWYFLFSSQMNSRIDWANFYLVAKNCKKTNEQKLDAGEKISLEFFNLDQLEQLTKNSEFRQTDFALWFLRSGEKLAKLLEN